MGTRRKPRQSKKQAAQSQNKWRNILIGGAIVAGVIALGYLLYTNLQRPQPPEAIAGVVDHEHQDRGHVEHEIEAGDLPLVGGIHSPEWQNCGIYDEPVRRPFPGAWGDVADLPA